MPRTSAARRIGRGHLARGDPCQDAYALAEQPERGRVVAAVADGLGSRPLSHLGSQAACDAAVASLTGEEAWDVAALRRAFVAARDAVAARAAADGLEAADLATTLQVACWSEGRVVAAMVGDGAVVAVGAEGPLVLLEPAAAEYANLVVPVTADDWQDSFRWAAADAEAALLFTDGLTRLLLTRSRQGWAPFAPFFDSFLPQMRAGRLDPGLAERFLASAAVDRAWDDDKCLVVIAHAADLA